MLISGPSLLRWGRRTTMRIMAIGSGLWCRAVGTARVRGDQFEQPRSERAVPAAVSAAPNGAAPGVSSPGRLPQQQCPALASVPPTVVRAWARTQGLPVADRGPIPGWVLDQYLSQGGRPASERRTTARTAPTRRTPSAPSSAA